MKNLKYILVLFLSVTFLSCSDDSSNTPSFAFTNANVSGTYGISLLDILVVESATSTSGATTTELERNAQVGDRFEMTIVLSSDGTYTAKGVHGLVSTITPTPQSGQPDPQTKIVDAAGTYTIDATLNTISLTQTSGDFISGTFTVTTFNENSLIMFQELTDNQGAGISTKTTTGVSFFRK